ncbi:MAG: DegT/DnrJ/EryC1/StrS family aminotransferase [Candidatus Norongarragalinales archaeon]
MDLKMGIPLSRMFVDEEMRKIAIDVLNSHKFIKGGNLDALEKDFAAFCGAKHGVGVSSGTTALYTAFWALGVGQGDEIIAPSHSFIATVNPAVLLGAKPVFVEIDEKTFNIDAKAIEKKITKKTKAIVPVHLYGQPADMDEITEIAEKRGIAVIEDACQAHDSEYKGKRVGSLGRIACFSFFPSKNMTVCGDGGMITTNDAELAEKMAMFRDQGRKDKYTHEMVGMNFRLSELHAALGRVQLKHLPEWTQKRRKHAALYKQLINPGKATLPFESQDSKHVFHMFVIRVKNREKLARDLKSQGIDTGVHYPIPIHLQPAMKEFYSESLPVTEKIAKEILSIPMSPLLTEDEVRFVSEKINALA